jgi:soluble lytic murein transglycosylase
MQVLPATGRHLARQLKLGRFRTSLLYRPDYNLRLGAFHFRSLLDEYKGYEEAALAAYNAGKNRADAWLAWAAYREPAEFIETIPITETRNYVQIVLRNAWMYRRIYAPKPPAPKPAAKKKASAK